jgi:hypothetical protein
MRQKIAEALALWREAADRRDSTQHHRSELATVAKQHRDAYRLLTINYMAVQIQALKEAEQRRAPAEPWSEAFRLASAETTAIAGEIANSARRIDRDMLRSDTESAVLESFVRQRTKRNTAAIAPLLG